MKKVFKRTLSLLLAITIIFGSAAAGLGEVGFADLFSHKAYAVNGGTCGDDVNWSLDVNGVLTISGTGEMYNYIYLSELDVAPWYDIRFNVKSIVINDGVTSVGDNAFSYCTLLESVVIPESVKRIGDYSFCNCYNLSSISLCDSITYIGCDSFSETQYYNNQSNWDNNSLYIGNHLIAVNNSIDDDYIIKDGTRSLAYGALSYCTSLKSVALPDSLIAIGDFAFSSCSELSSVVIPENVTYIGRQAFYECKSLSSVTIPENVAEIGHGIFAGCSMLSNISVAENNNYYASLDGILYNKDFTSLLQFPDNKVVDTYVIPDTVTHIHDWAFRNCNGISSVVIPDGVTKIGEMTFSGCENLLSVEFSDNITEIEDEAFYNCKSLSAILLPDGIEYIGNWAFSYCEEASELILPDSLNYIGDNAFERCVSLASVKLPESDVVFGDMLFADCTSITDIDFSESITTIPRGMFFGCTALEAVEIPDNITKICRDAFYFCENLNTIKLHQNIVEIGIWAFGYTGYYNNIFNWQNGLLFIDDILIKADTGIVGEYTIKDGTRLIADNAFYRCMKLEYITIPESVEFIGNGVFGYCTSLKKAIIKNDSVVLGTWIFEKCDVLENFKLPSNITAVPDGMFAICKSLTYMDIPDGVISIGSSAFEQCTNLDSIVVPRSVSNVGIYGFAHGTNVKNVFYKGNESDWGNIQIEEYNDGLLNAIIHFDATGHTASATKYDAVKRLEYKECTVCKVVLESKYIPLAITTITSCYNEVKGVQLKWNAVADAAKYNIYRKTSTQSTWTKLTTVSTLAYQDTNVTGNTIYQYKIKAVDQYGNVSDYSAQRECRFIATPKLKSISNTVGGLTITWEKVAGATSYRIYRRGAGTNYWYYLGDVSSTQNTFFDKESSLVKSGNYYRYTVRASYSGKDSAGKDYLIYSGFDTNGLYLKYVGSPKLTSISNATGGLQIKWNKVSGSKDLKYNVYRRGAGATTWTYLGTTTGTTWTDSEVKNSSGNYYRYTVRAIDGYYSAFDATGLYLMRLANPTLKSATSAKAGITVKWGSVKGATYYNVYRKTGSSSWTKIATVSGNANVSYLDKTAKKGTTYTYTVRAGYGSTTSYFNSGISCKDLY